MKVPDFPEPPSSVFMLASPNHMLGKLAWEIIELHKDAAMTDAERGHAPSAIASLKSA